MAVDSALKSAGISKRDLDKQGVVVNGCIYPHAEIWSAEVIQDLGLRPKRMIRVDNGGASAVTSLARADELIRLGVVDVVLCVSADAPNSVTTHPQPYFGEKYYYERNFEDVFGMQGPKSIFAFIMRRHMVQYGTRFEHTGKIAVVSRQHALMNPNAYFKKPITMEDYLSSPMLADPIRLLDCVIPVDGGLAFLVASEEYAKKVTDRYVYVLGLGESYNYFNGPRNRPDLTTTGVVEAAKQAYEEAGLGPEDVDVFEPYDDFTIAVIMQLEDAGFCKKGEGGKFVEKTDLSVQGELPMSTGGGQLSAGQPGMAGGFVPFVEGVRQLFGEGGQRQVKGARIALITGVGNLAHLRTFGNAAAAILGVEPQK